MLLGRQSSQMSVVTTIKTSRSDVIWSYVGTIVSMGSGFVLLPLLMYFLSDDELGLWYVYVAVANLALLFEFGFNPTFARNIVYVVSGARRLTRNGCDKDSIQEGIDWHLLNVVIRASKLVYAAIAIVVLIALAVFGSMYVGYITRGLSGVGHWIAWGVFCLSIFLNLYYLSFITVLRGYGDVAGENRSKTFAKLSQLVVSGVLLLMGFGLIGASIGYLANGLLMRVFASIRLRSHKVIAQGRASDERAVSLGEVRNVLSTIIHIAWRDGLVQIACYISTQAMSIISSLTLGLAATGTYSVLLQLATAVYHFAAAYPKSFFPAFQARYTENDVMGQRKIASTGVVAYWGLVVFGTAGVALVILPLLPYVKPGVVIDVPLFIFMCLYLGLWQQHSIFCNYIIGMNEIPYMRGYIVAAVLGVTLAFVFAGVLGWGAWGIVAGQAVSQLVFNNWMWPMYLAKKLGTTYRTLMADGFRSWWAKAASALRKGKGRKQDRGGKK